MPDEVGPNSKVGSDTEGILRAGTEMEGTLSKSKESLGRSVFGRPIEYSVTEGRVTGDKSIEVGISEGIVKDGKLIAGRLMGGMLIGWRVNCGRLTTETPDGRSVGGVTGWRPNEGNVIDGKLNESEGILPVGAISVGTPEGIIGDGKLTGGRSIVGRLIVGRAIDGSVIGGKLTAVIEGIGALCEGIVGKGSLNEFGNDGSINIGVFSLVETSFDVVP